MKKIVFTSNVTWAMVKFRYRLIKHLIQKGYSVYVVAPRDEFAVELEKMGCNCIDIRLNRKGVNPLEDISLTYNLYKIYKNIQPDIVFHYSIKPIIYGSIAAKLASVRSIAVNIGLGYTFINTNLITKISHQLYKFSLKFPEMVWFINEDDKNEFIKRGFVEASKTLVLPSEGIDLKYFQPLNETNVLEGKTVFLLIARMLEDKGVREFYEAAKQLKKHHSNVRFQLLGDSDMENPKGISTAELQRWDKEGVIEYLGYAKDVREFIGRCSCVVLPSYREGKGMTLIEAAAMQKPLIATDVEGCKDIVKDGYNGYLCQAKDSKNLAEVMEKFIYLEENKRQEMGKNARKFVQENFDVHKVIAIYMKTLERLAI